MLIVDKDSNEMDFIEFSRKEAIAEGIILKSEIFFHDPDVQYINKKGLMIKVPSLAKLNDDSIGSAIFAANRTQAAEDLIFRGLAALQKRLKTDHDAKGIIMAPSILEAVKIHKMLLRDPRTSHLAPLIATSDDSSARQNLKVFRNTSHSRVLVTIEMASEGYDVPEASFLILVTQIRSRVWIEQALGRVTRVNMHAPHDLEQKAFVYAFADSMMKKVLEDIRNEEEVIVVEKDILQAGEGVDQDQSLPSDIVPIASQIRSTTSFDLETGLSLNVISLRNAARNTGITATDEQLSAMAEQLTVKPKIISIPISVNDQTDALRKRIEAKVRMIALAKDKTPKELNKAIKDHYKKSRSEMELDELKTVWQDLCSWSDKNLRPAITE